MLYEFHRKTDYCGTAAAALASGLHHDHFKLLIFIYLQHDWGRRTLNVLRGALVETETHLHAIWQHIREDKQDLFYKC